MKLKKLGLLFILLIVVTLYFFIDPSSTFFPKCPLYATTGIYCPGCGSQRAFHDLLHFDLLSVIKHNLLFIFGIIILSYHSIVSLYNKFYKKNVTNLIYNKWTPKILLLIIVLFWILRNIPYYPFTLLKPD